METKALAATTSLKKVLEACRTPAAAFQAFKDWPLQEVRPACLEIMSWEKDIVHVVEWGKELVELLVAAGDFETAAEVLDWQLRRTWSIYPSMAGRRGWSREMVLDHCADERVLLVQSFEFAIAQSAQNYKLCSVTAKAITRLKESDEGPKLYKEITSLPAFLRNLLGAVEESSYEGNRWHGAERALRIIAYMKDHTFLDQIRRLATLHEKGKAGPKTDNPLASAANLGVLKEAVRLLDNL